MKKAWMISTACAAILALGGTASAQGMNEHGGKNAPAAEQKGAAPAPMNKAAPAHAGNAQNMEKNAAPSRAGSAQNMEKNSAPKTSAQGGAEGSEKTGSAKTTAQDNEKAGASVKTGQDMSKHPNSRSAADENRKGNVKSSETRSSETKSSETKSSEKVGEQKSGTSMSKEHTKAAAGKNGRSTTGSAPSAEVKLTTEQRTKIRKVVIEEKKIPRLTKVNFDIKVGVRVPRTVHFYPVPEEIITIHPAWRSYRVIFVNEELVLIDPTTFEIVYVITV